MAYPIEFAEQNPWWTTDTWRKEDKHLQTFLASAYQWDPRIKYFLDLTKDIVFTLRGPRQVGKTTLLKIMIAELIDKGTAPQNILYYACDLVDNPKELAGIIQRYVTTRRAREKKRLYVFMDEVSSVKGWQKGVKFLSDKGVLTNTTLILSGSHSLDLRVSAEQLPGRRGEATSTPDIIFLPMKFAEYAEVTDERMNALIKDLDILPKARRHEEILALSRGSISPTIEKLAFELPRTARLLDNYLVSGGIPRCVNEHLQTGKISESTYRTYVDVVKGDLMRYNKNENYLRQILDQLFQTLGTPVGWSTLKKGTDVASPNTVEDYALSLESSFVLSIFHRMNAMARRPEYAKGKKIVFGDPFFIHALHAWVLGKKPFEFTIDCMKETTKKSTLVEQVVGQHCIRLAYSFASQKQLFDPKTQVMFWRSREEREIDFVVLTNSNMISLEVKHQDEITRADFYALADFRKLTNTRGGIILSKDRLEARNGYSIVPASTFLLLI